MRTKFPVLVVMALGTATMMWTLSGFGMVYQQDASDPITGLESDQAVNDSASNSPAGSEGFSSSTEAQGDNIVGIILTGIQTIVGFASTVAMLPAEMMDLGWPSWAAGPLGTLAVVFVGIGIAQFASNRIYQ